VSIFLENGENRRVSTLQIDVHEYKDDLKENNYYFINIANVNQV
jgi:pyrimidine operon attenuation protein/uracil phosphoribosyltransferase